MEGQYLKDIEKGLKVEIITDKNRVMTGIVEDILSKAQYQMYGIRVRLYSGEIGRVQKIILTEEQKSKKRLMDIEKLIKNGESFHTEFKLSALWSQNYTEQDIRQSRSYDVHHYKQKASRIILAKSIAAFLNSDGGNLIIGIKEKKELKEDNNFEIIGIQDEFKKLKDQEKDGYKRMIIDEIIKPYLPSYISNHLNQYIEINFVDINNKVLCWIKIKKSEKRVFLSINDREIFMIRTETENRILEGDKLVEYCIKHFK